MVKSDLNRRTFIFHIPTFVFLYTQSGKTKFAGTASTNLVFSTRLLRIICPSQLQFYCERSNLICKH